MRFEDFVAFRDAWAVSGSSNIGTPIEIEKLVGKVSERKWEKVKISGKFANTLNMQDEELVRLCKEKKAAEIRPFRKLDEPAKTRTIQSYETTSYIRCSWIDSFFADYNGSMEWTTLGMSAHARAASYNKIAELMKTGQFVALSTD